MPAATSSAASPSPWAEWNDRFRDTVRESWLGGHDRRGARSAACATSAYRLAGSSDLFGRRPRPLASVNFVTAHDGFTLHDLVSYDHKHNEANGEDNRDGTDNNHSWNCGVEGDTDDPEVLALRRRMMRNLLATLLVSHRRPDAHRRRRDRSHPGRQQQRVLPDDEIVLAVMGPRARGSRTCSRGPARCSPCAATTRCCATTSSSRAGRRTPTASRTSRGSAPTARR